jgi:molecular chaperone GrpE (heat shock protein)
MNKNEDSQRFSSTDFAGTDDDLRIDERFGANSTSNTTVLRSSAKPTWRKADARRLRDLAAKSALLDATEAEERELAELMNLRRRVKRGVPAEQMIRDQQERKLIKNVLKALDEFVTFHG